MSNARVLQWSWGKSRMNMDPAWIQTVLDMFQSLRAKAVCSPLTAFLISEDHGQAYGLWLQLDI